MLLMSGEDWTDMVKITDAYVGALITNGKDVILWDDDVVGFGVRVKSSGIKSYVAQFRDITGKSCRTTIARCEDIPANDARRIAEKKMNTGKKRITEMAEAAETGNTCIICAGFCPSTSTCRKSKPSVGQNGVAAWPIVSADDWCLEGVFRAATDDF